jgi:hypothetical protein
MTSTRHPSYLELDRLALRSGGSPELTTHVADCLVCRAYLDSPAPVQTVPPWVEELATPGAPRRWRAPSTAFAVLLASAAAFLLWRQPTEHATYGTSKGAPSVLVHVQHEGVHSTWDGAPLMAGDQIRLEVAPEEFSYVSVFLPGEHGEPARLLFQGPVKRHARTPLDKAWQLDAWPADERLTVVFSRAPLTSSEVRRLLASPADEGRVIELVLPKRAAP